MLRNLVRNLIGQIDMPRHQDLNWNGLNFHSDDFEDIMNIEREKGIAEADAQSDLFDRFEDRLPQEMEAQREALKKRLENAPPVWQAGRS